MNSITFTRDVIDLNCKCFELISVSLSLALNCAIYFPSQFFSDSWIHNNTLSADTLVQSTSLPHTSGPSFNAAKPSCPPPLPCPLPLHLPPPSRYTACILSPPQVHCVDCRVPVNTVSVFFTAYSCFLCLTHWAQMIIDITCRGFHHGQDTLL